MKPEHENTKRYIVDNIFNIIQDTSYELNNGLASHNFRLFNFNNTIYGVGGQHTTYRCYLEFQQTTNTIYNNYNKNPNFLKSSDYKLNAVCGIYIYNPSTYCPYYANGLYLFSFKNNIQTIENNNLPIIDGLKNGRYDGFYGSTLEYTSDINKCKDGLSVFDSSTSILFNEKEQLYYLYQRANLCRGARAIQYTTSNDLIKWSDWKLLDITPYVNPLLYNFYYNNMFKMKDIDMYIGILPCLYNNTNSNEYLNLYYSNDCVKWHYIGIINTHIYYKLWMVIGEPILYNNKHYFYFSNVEYKSIDIYTMDENRFSYIQPIDKNKIAKIFFKPMYLDKIIINFKTYNDGYLIFQLRDNMNNIIDGYSFQNFNKINNNMDSYEYVLSWNNNLPFFNIFNKEIYIEIEGMNYNIFSINNKLVYCDLII